MQIPPERLSPEVLEAVIVEFISREGTDYGVSEVSLETKVEQVKRQVQRGEVVVTFDPETESCNLLTRREFLNAQSSGYPD
ncbi:YheU family protein [Porticoccaceae bacterium LTM1]|nr:YheU family protein [Porticoccaceae bacterium LTM1]